MLYDPLNDALSDSVHHHAEYIMATTATVARAIVTR